MDVKAILRKLNENPERTKNAEYFRQLLDSSEAKDSDDLNEFVEGLLKPPEFGARAEVPQEIG